MNHRPRTCTRLSVRARSKSLIIQITSDYRAMPTTKGKCCIRICVNYKLLIKKFNVILMSLYSTAFARLRVQQRHGRGAYVGVELEAWVDCMRMHGWSAESLQGADQSVCVVPLTSSSSSSDPFPLIYTAQKSQCDRFHVQSMMMIYQLQSHDYDASDLLSVTCWRRRPGMRHMQTTHF